jgi:hypothetical protein
LPARAVGQPGQRPHVRLTEITEPDQPERGWQIDVRHRRSRCHPPVFRIRLPQRHTFRPAPGADIALFGEKALADRERTRSDARQRAIAAPGHELGRRRCYARTPAIPDRSNFLPVAGPPASADQDRA